MPPPELKRAAGAGTDAAAPRPGSGPELPSDATLAEVSEVIAGAQPSADPKGRPLPKKQMELGNATGDGAGGARPDLPELYAKVVEKARGSIGYYHVNKGWPRFWARMIRLGAIMLICAAGIVPLLDAAGLFPGIGHAGADQTDTGQLALLMAAIAAALLAADRFFGFSSTWARFTITELMLQRALDRFVFDWALSLAGDRAAADPHGAAAARIEMLRAFSMEVSQINEDETKVWVSEYQRAIATLERTAKEQKEALEAGTVRLAIQKSNTVRGPVKVLVDGNTRREDAGDTVILRQVAAGQHVVEVVAQDAGGQLLRETRVVDVPSGGNAAVSVQLG